jgi:hypothetical protein
MSSPVPTSTLGLGLGLVLRGGGGGGPFALLRVAPSFAVCFLLLLSVPLVDWEGLVWREWARREHRNAIQRGTGDSEQLTYLGVLK